MISPPALHDSGAIHPTLSLNPSSVYTSIFQSACTTLRNPSTMSDIKIYTVDEVRPDFRPQVIRGG